MIDTDPRVTHAALIEYERRHNPGAMSPRLCRDCGLVHLCWTWIRACVCEGCGSPEVEDAA